MVIFYLDFPGFSNFLQHVTFMRKNKSYKKKLTAIQDEVEECRDNTHTHTQKKPQQIQPFMGNTGAGRRFVFILAKRCYIASEAEAQSQWERFDY